MRYRICEKLDKEDGEIQVNSLVYCMGREAEKIFGSFALTAAQQKDFDAIVKKFDDYFIPRHTVIHDRAKFRQCHQKSGESVEAFYRSLLRLSENCGFREEEEEIRDQLVIGMKDKDLSMELQLKADLTLAYAIERARSSETPMDSLWPV